MNEVTRIIAVLLPVELWRKLKRLAVDKDTTLKKLIEEAVVDKLKKEDN